MSLMMAQWCPKQIEEISYSPFRALLFNNYNSNQLMHTTLLNLQKCYKTPAPSCFGPYGP